MECVGVASALQGESFMGSSERCGRQFLPNSPKIGMFFFEIDEDDGC